MLLPLHDDPLRALSDGLLGQVLPGSGGRFYPLRERIGEGGQGWVFRATWNGSVDVVVKVLRPDAVNKESLARFQREAQVLQMLSQQSSPNPHVVRFFDHAYATIQVAATGKSWDLPFTVMELVDGETLEKAIERAQPGGIGLERARRIVAHVVFALQDVHARNVVHRNLKPSNILLSSPGGRGIAKVTDFGLAKLLDPGMHRTTHLAGATVGYAPPEQFENGNLRVGRHTDVFSLAAIFYELVCGKPAFPFGENEHPLMVIIRILNEARPTFARVRDRLPGELADRPDVVAALDAELHRALAPDTAERHATVNEFHDGIERAFGALAAVPSMVFGGFHGGVMVRPSGPPGGGLSGKELLEAARTVQVEAVAQPIVKTAPMLPVVPVARASSPSVAAPAGTPGWRRLTGPSMPESCLSIASSASGDRAIAVGPQGAARWDRGAWTLIELPPEADASRMRAVAWHEDTMFFAGAWPMVTAVSPRTEPGVWRVDRTRVTFHGAYADATGIILAGQRATKAGPVGVVAEISLIAPGAAPHVMEVPGCGPLRAATRLGSGILACGDAGALVLISPTAQPRVVNACEPTLHAVLTTSDGTAVVVGGGGFVFRVWPTLETRLDAIQTTKDLFALTQAPNGTLYCGGAGGRVLRRDAQGWVRIGGSDGDGTVRALWAGASKVVAFADDGAVAECLTG